MEMTKGKRNIILFIVAGVLCAVAGFFIGASIFKLSDVKPPLFMVYIPEVSGEVEGIGFIGNWQDPSAVAVSENHIVVLDTGKDRILILDKDEELEQIIGQSGATSSLFKQPEGLAMMGDRLYVANTQAAEVIIINISGEIENVIKLPKSAETPNPTGIAVLSSGAFYVSDTANNVVLHYDSSGNVVSRLGNGTDEANKFAHPHGLAIDTFGSLYVADTMNGRIKKFSPEGRYLDEYLITSNPDLSWPVGVAVGPDGTIYTSDRKRLLVHAFTQANAYLGVVALLDATKIDSPSVVRDPYGLSMVGDRLYIADREKGIFGFDFDPRYWTELKETQMEMHFK
jgi:sugar lactone lactonase YvrE